MQRTITKRRKKIAKELECSFSAAPFSGSTICSIVSSLVAFCRYKLFILNSISFQNTTPPPLRDEIRKSEFYFRLFKAFPKNSFVQQKKYEMFNFHSHGKPPFRIIRTRNSWHCKVSNKIHLPAPINFKAMAMVREYLLTQKLVKFQRCQTKQ